MDVSPIEFGKYLKSLRNDKKMTLEALGLDIELTKQHLSNLENGRRGIPSPEILERISKCLDVSYRELMIKAGYWKEQYSEEDNQYFERLYLEHFELNQKIIELMNAIVDDEGFFPEYLHEEIFNIFEDWLYLDNNYETHEFAKSYRYEYLNKSEDELTERDRIEMENQFNKFYNYSNIKRALVNYREGKYREEFISELISLMEKHKIQIPTKSLSFTEVDLLNLLKDDSMLIRFNNKLLSNEQRYVLLGYLKAQEYMGSFDK